MYKGIWLNTFRNYCEVSYKSIDQLKVGLTVGILRSRRSSDGVTNYSITTDCTIISIQDSVGGGSLVTLETETGTVRCEFEYKSMVSKSITGSYSYESRLVDVNKWPIEFMSNNKLYYITFPVEITVCGMVTSKLLDLASFGRDVNDAINNLKKTIDITFKVGSNPIVRCGSPE